MSVLSHTQQTSRGRPVIANVSLTAAGVFAVLTFGAGLASGGTGNAVAGVCISCWLALPLTLLGLVRLYRGFPLTHLILLVLGLLVSAFAAASPFDHSSTSAIGLMTIPFFLLVVYALAGLVLVCVRVYKK